MSQVHDDPAPRVLWNRGVGVSVHSATRGCRQLRIHTGRVEMHTVVAWTRFLPFVRKEGTISRHGLIEHPSRLIAEEINLHVGKGWRRACVPCPVPAFDKGH